MSENWVQTLHSFIDEPDEKAKAAMGVGLLGIVYAAKNTYDAIATVYPDDALSIVGVGSLTLASVGGFALYQYKKNAEQQTIAIDRDEIHNVVENATNETEDDIEDGVFEEVDNTQTVENTEENVRLSRRTLSDREDFENFQKKLQDATHLYVNATSGSGKSVLINNYLQQDLGKGSKFVVLDPKPEGVNALKWKGAYKVVNDPSQFEAVLERVVGIMKQRQLNSAVEYPLLTIVIDEFSVLSEQAVDYVSVLLGLSRSSNIKLIMLTQTTSASFNGLNGRTDLFNGVTIISLGFNEEHKRVVSFAKISNGKLRKIGEDVVVPKLPVPWMEAERPFVDDSDSFGFSDEDNVITPIIETNQPSMKTTIEMVITEFGRMLSEKSGVDLSEVVEDYLTKTDMADDDDELPPMLKERTTQDETKYNFQPNEYNDKNVPPLKVTVGIIKNGNLRDSGMPKIGDTIITEGDIAAIKYLNTLFGDSNHRKQISLLVFGTHSRYHYKAISAILGDK